MLSDTQCGASAFGGRMFVQDYKSSRYNGPERVPSKVHFPVRAIWIPI